MLKSEDKLSLYLQRKTYIEFVLLQHISFFDAMTSHMIGKWNVSVESSIGSFEFS